MEEQLLNGVGIFACDDFTVLTAGSEVHVGNVSGHVVRSVAFDPAAVGVSRDGTAGNTLLFMNAWAALWDLGVWDDYDFTLKVDPDAVLLPSRLRLHLHNTLKSEPRANGTYLKNCNKFPGSPNFPMMYGALEVFSHAAMRNYFNNKWRCETELVWQPWGEDFYMTKCLNLLGVEGLGNYSLLGDSLCLGAKCGDGIMSAYHPFKNATKWFECWEEAVRSRTPGDTSMLGPDKGGARRRLAS